MKVQRSTRQTTASKQINFCDFCLRTMSKNLFACLMWRALPTEYARRIQINIYVYIYLIYYMCINHLQCDCWLIYHLLGMCVGFENCCSQSNDHHLLYCIINLNFRRVKKTEIPEYKIIKIECQKERECRGAQENDKDSRDTLSGAYVKCDLLLQRPASGEQHDYACTVYNYFRRHTFV